MSVNRYEFEDYGTNEDEGRYVTYEDYAALERKLAESQREFRAADATIENLQMQVEKLAAEVYDLKHPGTYPPSKRETPDTDAFLAEVRAQGVEMLVKHCEQKALEKSYDFFMDAGAVAAQFAAQLRQEAAQ